MFPRDGHVGPLGCAKFHLKRRMGWVGMGPKNIDLRGFDRMWHFSWGERLTWFHPGHGSCGNPCLWIVPSRMCICRVAIHMLHVPLDLLISCESGQFCDI